MSAVLIYIMHYRETISNISINAIVINIRVKLCQEITSIIQRANDALFSFLMTLFMNVKAALEQDRSLLFNLPMTLFMNVIAALEQGSNSSKTLSSPLRSVF